MRVVQLVTQRRGGPVDHAVDVACELAARGYDSHLVGPVEAFGPRLDAAGVSRHAVTVGTKSDVRGVIELSRLIGALRPDVLHCQDMRAGMVGRLIGRHHAIGTVVYTIHGVPERLSDRVAGNARIAAPRRRDLLFYLAGERWLARVAPSSIVVPCAAVADYLRDHVRLPARSVRIVPNGIDTSRFRPAANQPRRAVTALWLGVMGPIKRVDRIVRSVAEIPELSLLLVGAGQERTRIQELVRTLGLEQRVTLRDFVDDPAPVFDEADLFVLPSAAEALPLALLQAMSAAVPVVTTRVGGIPEVVRDGIDGLLVPADDAGELTRAVRALATDQERRTSMGRSARRRVVEQFTLSTCVDRLVDVYQGGGG